MISSILQETPAGINGECNDPPRLQTLKDRMQHVSHLRMFIFDKDMCDMLELVTSVEDKLCRHAIEAKYSQS